MPWIHAATKQEGAGGREAILRAKGSQEERGKKGKTIPCGLTTERTTSILLWHLLPTSKPALYQQERTNLTKF